ncbi:MAG: energy transducer TonB [Salinibacter sp.]
MGVSHGSSADPSLLDAYPVRMMLGLVASLSLMIVLVRLPLQPAVNRVGWSTHSSPERIMLTDVSTPSPENKEAADHEKNAPPQKDAPPPTKIRTISPNEASPPVSAEASGSGADSTRRDSAWSDTYDDVQSIAELGTKDSPPQIVGGMGTLYLHIRYPEKARERGIQGTLKLEFTVERDGSVTDVEVVKSLHPLCDSAAVKGIRSVRFVPAKQNGTPVPIRLRLPVEFRLRTLSTSASTGGQGP